MPDQDAKCYSCARLFQPGAKPPVFVDTREDQCVLVGPECARKIVAAGEDGWQPPNGGPRLYALSPEREAYFQLAGQLPVPAAAGDAKPIDGNVLLSWMEGNNMIWKRIAAGDWRVVTRGTGEEVAAGNSPTHATQQAMKRRGAFCIPN